MLDCSLQNTAESSSVKSNSANGMLERQSKLSKADREMFKSKV